MTYIPRSSFTPGAVPQQIQKTRTVNLVSLLANIFFALSLISMGGMYAYKLYADKQLTEAKNTLASVSQDTIRNAQKDISAITSFDGKLRLSTALVERHLSVDKVFTFLEEVTKETVQYTDFKFSYDPGYEAEVSVTGVTSDFASVVLQKSALTNASQVSTFVISDIANQNSSEGASREDGTASNDSSVSFTLVGNLVSNAIGYGKDDVPDAPKQISESVASGTVETVPSTTTELP
jgi:hypothetical protein